MSKTIKSIVLVEDDDMFIDRIENELRKEFGPDLAIDISDSESKFLRKLESYKENPPDVFVFDMRVRWADADTIENCPPQPGKEDPARAGLRCLAEIETHLPTSSAHVFTILDRWDIQAKFGSNEAERVLRCHVNKVGGLETLIDKIRSRIVLSQL